MATHYEIFQSLLNNLNSLKIDSDSIEYKNQLDLIKQQLQNIDKKFFFAINKSQIVTANSKTLAITNPNLNILEIPASSEKNTKFNKKEEIKLEEKIIDAPQNYGLLQLFIDSNNVDAMKIFVDVMWSKEESSDKKSKKLNIYNTIIDAYKIEMEAPSAKINIDNWSYLISEVLNNFGIKNGNVLYLHKKLHDNKEIIKYRDNKNNNLLHLAILSGSVLALRMIFAEAKQQNLLHKMLTEKNSSGYTPYDLCKDNNISPKIIDFMWIECTAEMRIDILLSALESDNIELQLLKLLDLESKPQQQLSLLSAANSDGEGLLHLIIKKAHQKNIKEKEIIALWQAALAIGCNPLQNDYKSASCLKLILSKISNKNIEEVLIAVKQYWLARNPDLSSQEKLQIDNDIAQLLLILQGKQELKQSMLSSFGLELAVHLQLFKDFKFEDYTSYHNHYAQEEILLLLWQQAKIDNHVSADAKYSRKQALEQLQTFKQKQLLGQMLDKVSSQWISLNPYLSIKEQKQVKQDVKNITNLITPVSEKSAKLESFTSSEEFETEQDLQPQLQQHKLQTAKLSRFGLQLARLLNLVDEKTTVDVNEFVKEEFISKDEQQQKQDLIPSQKQETDVEESKISVMASQTVAVANKSLKQLDVIFMALQGSRVDIATAASIMVNHDYKSIPMPAPNAPQALTLAVNLNDSKKVYRLMIIGVPQQLTANFGLMFDIDNISYEVFNELTKQVLPVISADKIKSVPNMAALDHQRKRVKREILAEALLVGIYLLNNNKASLDNWKSKVLLAYSSKEQWQQVIFGNHNQAINIKTSSGNHKLNPDGNVLDEGAGALRETQTLVLLNGEIEQRPNNKSLHDSMVEQVLMRELQVYLVQILTEDYSEESNAPLNQIIEKLDKNHTEQDKIIIEEKKKEKEEKAEKEEIDERLCIALEESDYLANDYYDTDEVGFNTIVNLNSETSHKMEEMQAQIAIYYRSARTNLLQLPAHISEIEIAVLSGSFYNIPKFRDDLGNGWLHWAIKNRNIEMTERLLEMGASLHQPNAFGITPLQLIVFLGPESKVFQILGLNTQLLQTKKQDKKDSSSNRKHSPKDSPHQSPNSSQSSNDIEKEKSLEERRINAESKLQQQYQQKRLTFADLINNSDYEQLQLLIDNNEQWEQAFIDSLNDSHQSNFLKIAITKANAAFEKGYSKNTEDCIKAFSTLRICLKTLFNAKVLNKITKKINLQTYADSPLNHDAVAFILNFALKLLAVHQQAMLLNSKTIPQVLTNFNLHKQQITEYLRGNNHRLEPQIASMLLTWFETQNIFSPNIAGETIFHTLMVPENLPKQTQGMWGVIDLLAGDKISSLATLPGKNEDSALIQVAVANGFAFIAKHLAAKTRFAIVATATKRDIHSNSSVRKLKAQQQKKYHHFVNHTTLVLDYIEQSIGLDSLTLKEKLILLHQSYEIGLYEVCARLLYKNPELILENIYKKSSSNKENTQVLWLELFFNEYQSNTMLDKLHQQQTNDLYEQHARQTQQLQQQTTSLQPQQKDLQQLKQQQILEEQQLKQYQQQEKQQRQLLATAINNAINLFLIKWLQNGIPNSTQVILALSKYCSINSDCVQISLDFSQQFFESSGIKKLFIMLRNNKIKVAAINLQWAFDASENKDEIIKAINAYIKDCNPQLKLNVIGTNFSNKDVNKISNGNNAEIVYKLPSVNLLNASYYSSTIEALQHIFKLTLMIPPSKFSNKEKLGRVSNIKQKHLVLIEDMQIIKMEVINLLHKMGEIAYVENAEQYREQALKAIREFNYQLQQLAKSSSLKEVVFLNPIAWAIARTGIEIESMLYNQDFQKHVIFDEFERREEQQGLLSSEKRGKIITNFGEIFEGMQVEMLRGLHNFRISNSGRLSPKIALATISSLQQRFLNLPIPDVNGMPPMLQEFMRGNLDIDSMRLPQGYKDDDLINIGEIRIDSLFEGINSSGERSINIIIHDDGNNKIKLITRVLQFALSQQLMILQPESKLSVKKNYGNNSSRNNANQEKRELIESLSLHFCMFWSMFNYKKFNYSYHNAAKQDRYHKLIELMLLWLRYVPIAPASANQNAEQKTLATLYGTYMSVTDVVQRSGFYCKAPLSIEKQKPQKQQGYDDDSDSGGMELILKKPKQQQPPQLLVIDTQSTSSEAFGSFPLIHAIAKANNLLQEQVQTTFDVFNVIVADLSGEHLGLQFEKGVKDLGNIELLQKQIDYLQEQNRLQKDAYEKEKQHEKEKRKKEKQRDKEEYERRIKENDENHRKEKELNKEEVKNTMQKEFEKIKQTLLQASYTPIYGGNFQNQSSHFIHDSLKNAASPPKSPNFGKKKE